MGSDSSPSVLFEAVLKAAADVPFPCTFVVLVAHTWAERLSMLYSSIPRGAAPIEFQLCEDWVAMDEDPLTAVRFKKAASMLVGISLLKEQNIDALVSAGHTGVMIAGASLSLPKLEGIDRPALLALLPTRKKPIVVVDVGGSLSCRACHYIQYAHMGVAFRSVCYRDKLPVVGLLNVGSEAIKGTKELIQAHQLLKEFSSSSCGGSKSPVFSFIGNVEAREIFDGNVDVVVTDGFTGNVLLKAVEGVASFVISTSIDALSGTALASEAAATISALQHQFDYAEYPGAILCGIDGIIIKCHGSSSSKAMYHAIHRALSLVKEKFIVRLKNVLSAISVR
jgi:glycerol-3-phosphate acyltransferase PlsX